MTGHTVLLLFSSLIPRKSNKSSVCQGCVFVVYTHPFICKPQSLKDHHNLWLKHQYRSEAASEASLLPSIVFSHLHFKVMGSATSFDVFVWVFQKTNGIICFERIFVGMPKTDVEKVITFVRFVKLRNL